jgi:hypothetical protein
MLDQISSLSPEDLQEFDVNVDDVGTKKEEEVVEGKAIDTTKKTTDISSLGEDFIKEVEDAKEEDEEGDKAPKKEVEDKVAEPKKSSKKESEVEVDFNAVYQKYVKKGLWVPVTDEDGNEVQIDDEATFEKLMDWQVQNAADLTLKEREQEFGEQYQTLVTHLKNGGKIEDLSSIYEQEKNIDDIDVSEDSGAEEVIQSYYESLGWDKQEIKDQIETLKDKGSDYFSSFAEKRKKDLKKYFDEEKQEIVTRQEEYNKRIKDYQEKYNKDLKKLIHSQETPEREKKELEKFYYDFKNNMGGKKSSDFHLKFEEVKQDPAKWLKLIQFVKDIDSFEKREKAAEKITASIFKKVRTGESIKDSETPEAVEKKKPQAPTTFKRLFNN